MQAEEVKVKTGYNSTNKLKLRKKKRKQNKFIISRGF